MVLTVRQTKSLRSFVCQKCPFFEVNFVLGAGKELGLGKMLCKAREDLEFEHHFMKGCGVKNSTGVF